MPEQTPSVTDLQAEVEAARQELLSSIADLKAATAPGALAGRGVRSVTGMFTDEFGGIRPERVAIAAGVIVGIIAVSLIRRSRR